MAHEPACKAWISLWAGQHSRQNNVRQHVYIAIICSFHYKRENLVWSLMKKNTFSYRPTLLPTVTLSLNWFTKYSLHPKKECNSRFLMNQTVSSLTKFIQNSISIYVTK